MNHADELIENCKNYFIGQFSLIKFSRTLSVFDMFPDLTYTARASDPCWLIGLSGCWSDTVEDLREFSL
jgi:hypothetical protein